MTQQIEEVLRGWSQGDEVAQVVERLSALLPEATVRIEGDAPWEHVVIERGGRALVVDCLPGNGRRVRVVDGGGHLVGVHAAVEVPGVGVVMEATPLEALAEALSTGQRATVMNPRHLLSLQGRTPEDELFHDSVVISTGRRKPEPEPEVDEMPLLRMA